MTMAVGIARSIFDRLDFDFDAALADFSAAKEAHRFTINVPAPTAHPLVEQAYKAGGYVIVEDESGMRENDPASLTSRVARLETDVAAIHVALVAAGIKT
jgi:outer membrane murein-binding lipoprotein Lpp